MGLMADPTSGAQLILTPHPVTLDGQRQMAAALEPGENLGGFLRRVVPDWHEDAWEVRVNGVLVPVEVLDRVRPKQTALVEVRGIVKKQVLAIVAFAVLAYFTMGAGLAAYGAAVGVTSAIGLSVLGAVTFAAGAALINKVLGPKPPSADSGRQADPVYSISSARNAPRAYEPLPLLLGTVRITPDVASNPYSWIEGTDQILGMVLTPGVNVHSVEALYNGDTALDSYDGVATYLNGFGGHPDQAIPLYSNADTLAGGTLEKTGNWVERTTPLDTVRVQVNLEYMLGDVTSKGKPHPNRETVVVEYRETGDTTWLPLTSRQFVNNTYDTKRATISADVARGQYDVRVRRLGQAFEEKNGKAAFQYLTLTAVQADDTDYTGIPRIGIRVKATGQLNGALDELRCVAHSAPVPVWDGTAWVTQQTSNPGAHLLAYARGFRDVNNRLLAGIGLPDTQIDIPALQAFMVHCAANGYTYDAYIKDGRNHQEMVEAIALAGFGQTTWAGGRFSVAWASADQPLTGVVNMATIKRGSFQVDYTLANGADGVEFTYVDGTEWKPVTLRVPAPGVTTMQNPARITGEGVTTEAHAARLARYHLAQSLYQYKDISFATDLEHLTYRRMSLLAMSHDMTQWGYGGRLRAAADVGGVVTVTLDEPVPFVATPYIGLRVPGEMVYRVFPVAAFAGESDTLTLADPWPAGVPFPGDAEGNPVHDTIWIYDIKATPGYRVRVVQVEPENDLQGARVTAVAESAEFWTYVHTGTYIPPVNESLLQGRPVVTGLVISERQVVQDDTTFTELTATFDVSGKMAYATVDVSQWIDDQWSEAEKVAETRTTSARFRVPAAGVYRITVRPYAEDGTLGIPATGQYATEGADIPPPAFDLFNVLAVPGGLRKYSWAYLPDTLQAPDFAGAEIRYIAGTVADPDWDTMTPVGDDGFHPAAFEASVPVAGTWTFAARARNTSGELSVPVVITRTLTDNLGEVVDVIGGRLDEAEQAAIDIQTALDAEEAARIAADLQVALDAGADATAKANAALASAMAAVSSLEAQIADITGAPEWDIAETYDPEQLVKYGGGLYRALVQTTGHQPDISPTQWEKVGDYDSLGEAVAAALSMATTTADDLSAQVTRIDAITARMPTGTGDLATEALVASEVSALASDIAAEAGRVDAIVARMPAGSGALATQASVSSEATARANADTALSNRVGVVEARMPSGSGQLATSASVTTVDNASVSRDNALGSRVTAVEARMPTGSGELATASALSSLSGTVSTQGGQITAVANDLSSVQTTVNGQTASIAQLAEVTGSAPQSLVRRGTFSGSSGKGGWGAGMSAPLATSGHPSGWYVQVSAGVYEGITAAAVEVMPGDVIDLEVDSYGGAIGSGGSSSFGLQFINAAGGSLSQPAPIVTASGQSWQMKKRASVVAPADAARARPVIFFTGTGYAAYGRLVARRRSTIEASMAARHTVALDVNGYISGTVNENTGTTSSFGIRADAFSIQPSSPTGERLHWSGGNLRIYDSAGTLRVRLGVW